VLEELKKLGEEQPALEEQRRTAEDMDSGQKIGGES